MRLGFDHYTIAHRGLDPSAVLAFARGRGLEGVQFPEPAALDPGLDPARLAECRRQADALGLYLEVGLPSPNPVRRDREGSTPGSAGEHAARLRPHLEAAAALGVRFARAYVGDRHDRFRTDVAWNDQVAATAEVLRLLRDDLRGLGLRVAIETHADLTAEELLGLVASVGEDVLGVTLDTGNLAMRLDDPVRAAERLAPLVLMTHVKDCVLAFTPRGLCWQCRPVGSGIVPLADVLAPLARANPELNLSIELHPRIYDLPIFDAGWLAHFPELRPAGLAAIVRLAAECERRFAEGTLDRPEALETIHWADRDLDWLARSVGYLRPVVGMLGSLGA
jgi:sugar phosphate isomerase/epimerase